MFDPHTCVLAWLRVCLLCCVRDCRYTPAGPRLPVGFECSDTESGLNPVDDPAAMPDVQLGVGTYPGGDDVIPLGPWAASDTNGFLDALITGVEGARYYLLARAVNGALTAAFYTSTGWLFDSTAPEAVFVRDGASIFDAEYWKELDSVALTWRFTDPQSPIAGVEVAVGTTPGGTDVLDFKAMSPQPEGSATVSLGAARLVPGVYYYTTVRATNDVALSSVLSSNGFLVDPTPPACSLLQDGLGDVDIECVAWHAAAGGGGAAAVCAGSCSRHSRCSWVQQVRSPYSPCICSFPWRVYVWVCVPVHVCVSQLHHYPVRAVRKVAVRGPREWNRGGGVGRGGDPARWHACAGVRLQGDPWCDAGCHG